MSDKPTPEQLAEMQERISKMSPEELKELQKQQCIFCQIIAGKVNSRKVYEDEKCIAVLDINPANPGHMLLMPKEHYPLMPLIPDELIGHLFMAAKALSRVLLTAVDAEGADIFIANGVAAGQRAQHFMLHIIPRRVGDAVNLDIPYKDFPKKDIDETRKKIIARINSIFRQEKEIIKEKPKEKKEAAKTSAEEVFEKLKGKEEKFVTSEKAKKYHKEDCPFAQKITKEKKLFLTEKEGKSGGKSACSCITGSKKKKEKKSAEKKSEAQKEKIGLDDIARLFK